VRNAPPGRKVDALKALLDSLGFFTSNWDTLSKDTIGIIPGSRSRIDAIVIKSGLPLTADSVEKLGLPRAYDAGEIISLAKKTVYLLGTKGYPFAALSITIIPKEKPTGLMDAFGRRSFTVVFDVRENGRYVFARPIITGAFKTSKKLLLHDIVFREGQLFDLRKVSESRRRLLSRPYVAAAEASSPTVSLDAVLTPDSGVAASPPLDKVIVPFSCADKKGFGFDGAVTFSAGGASLKNSFFGIVDLSLLNMLGGGEAGRLSYNGQTDLQRMDLTLSKPYPFDFPVFTSLDFGLEIKQDAYGYLHGGLEVLTELRAFWQLGLAIKAHEVQYPGDSATATSQFWGADIILVRQPLGRRAGELSQGFSLRTGSGLAQTNGRQFNRWNIDAAGSIHVPFTKRWAVAGGISGKTYVTDPGDTLRAVELFRTGGYRSLRGYSDYEYAFKTVAVGQAELLFYFGPEGALFAFADAGLGFGPQEQMTIPSATKMFGYGLGIRIPSKLGTASIEWARNYTETKSLGRIHISVMNPVAAGMGK
jgi:outer membrane protein assembly factor BamA